MGPVCMMGNVTVPCANTGWDVGVQALYLKPSYSDELAWAGVNSSTLTSQPGGILTTLITDTQVENDPAWSWGFKLEAAYHFSTGNDLNLNWYHLVPKTTNSIITTSFVDPVAPNGSIDGSASSDLLSIKPSWDAINLEFGQHVDFSQHKKIRFHGGVQFAQIKTAESANTTLIENRLIGQNLHDVITTATQISTTAQFYGFGPRVGADMSYLLDQGLAIYANGATAILTGKSKYTQTTTATSVTVGGPPNPTLSSDVAKGNRTAFVPEMEAKLGLKYTCAMSRGDLILDAGYMWINYFNAQTVLLEDSNFDMQGPFLGVKWLGKV